MSGRPRPSARFARIHPPPSGEGSKAANARTPPVPLLRAHRRRDLCPRRRRLHADLQRFRRHQLRARRVRHARRHGDVLRSSSGRADPACGADGHRRGHGGRPHPAPPCDRAGARRVRRHPHHHHHRCIDLPARRRRHRVRQELPQLPGFPRLRAVAHRRGGTAAAEHDRADRRGRDRRCAVGVHDHDADRQGAGRDLSQSPRRPPCRHQHRRHRRTFVRGLGGDRRDRRRADDADHADELRRRHAAGAEGFRRRDARRHGQPARRRDRRADRRPAGATQRRLRLVGLQGRHRVPGDPRRAVRACRKACSAARRSSAFRCSLRCATPTRSLSRSR